MNDKQRLYQMAEDARQHLPKPGRKAPDWLKKLLAYHPNPEQADDGLRYFVEWQIELPMCLEQIRERARKSVEEQYPTLKDYERDVLIYARYSAVRAVTRRFEVLLEGATAS